MFVFFCALLCFPRDNLRTVFNMPKKRPEEAEASETLSNRVYLSRVAISRMWLHISYR